MCAWRRSARTTCCTFKHLNIDLSKSFDLKSSLSSLAQDLTRVHYECMIFFFFLPPPESYFERFGCHLCWLWNISLSNFVGELKSWSITTSQMCFQHYPSSLKLLCSTVLEYLPLCVKSVPFLDRFWEESTFISRGPLSLFLWDKVEWGGGVLTFFIWCYSNFIIFLDLRIHFRIIQ